MNKKLKYLLRRNTWRSLSLAAFALVLMQGCVTIDDSMDDCFPLARLQFVYTYNMHDEDRFRDQVESLDLYVYRQKDSTLVATRHFDRAEMARQNYSLSLQWLSQGDYYIVAFGNQKEDHYYCSGYNHMADMRLSMICSDGLGTILRNPSPFFHGWTELGSRETEEKVIEMVKNTNDINIRIVNKVPTRADYLGLPDLEISITAKNGTLKHNNSLAGDDSRIMNHKTNGSFPELVQELTTTLTVGRLFENDATKVIIKEKDTGRLLSTDNLTDKIVELLSKDTTIDMEPDEYLDREDSYDLEYTVSMKYGVLVATLVQIGDWKVNENNTGGL